MLGQEKTRTVKVNVENFWTGKPIDLFILLSTFNMVCSLMPLLCDLHEICTQSAASQPASLQLSLYQRNCSVNAGIWQ